MSNKTQTPRKLKTKNESGALAIMKKEFARFFTDGRMVITTILLPGLMIFALYTVMGTAMKSAFTVDEDYVPKQYVVDMPDSMQGFMQQAGLSFESISADEVDQIKQQITDQEIDLLVVFPQNFDAETSSAFSAAASYEPPLVEVFYNSARTESNASYVALTSVLDAFKNSQFNLFSVNSDGATYDLVTDRDAAGFMLASMLPMLMMIFVFSGCMSIAPESIAGEKERGTIATLLVTPLKRWELAVGKIVSISCIALLSGISSFIGTILSLPSMMSAGSETFSIDYYGIGEYAMLLAVILSTVLLFVGLISIISTFAKSIKEANSAVMPLMIVVMLVAVTAMFSTSAQGDSVFYLIPAYNSVQSMTAIFSFDYNPINIALTIGVNIGIAGICVFVLTKMFNSEKIIFSR